MAVKGVLPTTFVDYPQKVAAVLFIGGCPLRCAYCHNPELIAEGFLPNLELAPLLSELARRRPFLDGVVVSGGEPCLWPGLPGLLRRLKEAGFSVKLDSNGLYPAVLQAALEQKLVDYLALDVKTTPERYGELGALDAESAARSLRASLSLWRASGVDGEVRTTLAPPLVDAHTLLALRTELLGIRRWALQQFRPEQTLDPSWQSIAPYGPEALASLAALAEPATAELIRRGF